MSPVDESIAFNLLVLTALTSQQFRTLLKNNPKEAIKQLGVKPTDERVKAIKNLDFQALEDACDAFGGSCITG